MCRNNKSNRWIFDCGATDTMIYEVSDFKKCEKSSNTDIQTEN